MNIKALTAAAFGLALPFSAVLVSAPAHAVRDCSMYRFSPNLYQQCMADNTVASNDDGTPGLPEEYWSRGDLEGLHVLQRRHK
jgi:hypothetical protein